MGLSQTSTVTTSGLITTGVIGNGSSCLGYGFTRRFGSCTLASATTTTSLGLALKSSLHVSLQTKLALSSSSLDRKLANRPGNDFCMRRDSTCLSTHSNDSSMPPPSMSMKTRKCGPSLLLLAPRLSLRSASICTPSTGSSNVLTFSSPSSRRSLLTSEMRTSLHRQTEPRAKRQLYSLTNGTWKASSITGATAMDKFPAASTSPKESTLLEI